MNELVLLWPGYWPALLALPPLLLVLGVLQRRWHQRRARLLGANGLRLHGRSAWSRTRAALAAGSAAMVAFALLQPVAPGPATAGGADVVVCVDVSRSMAARDVGSTRAEAAETQIRRCVAAAPRSRFALVAFAGTAELIVPLTADGEAVVTLAAELRPGAVAGGGTDPGAAIDVAVTLLQQRGGGAIVMLGDGEDFVGRAVAAASAARAANCTVHTIGVGAEGGSKIVVDDGGNETFWRDRDGREVITQLEVAQLAAWAEAGGGVMRRAQHGDELARLHDDVLVPAAQRLLLQRGELEPVHRFHVPLLVALLLWMLRRCMPEYAS